MSGRIGSCSGTVTVSEASTEKSFCNYALKRGCLPYKLSSPGNRSLPDRMILCPGGFVFFIEFKAPGKKMTKHQTLVAERIRKLGFVVVMFDNADNARRYLDAVLSP